MAKRTVRLGLYGCGNRTRALLDSLYGENEYQVVAAYDIRKEAIKEVCERYGGKLCKSAEELLSCKEAEAFIISLDPFAHPDAFDKAVEVSKPIFLEKPIASTAERAYRMMKKAQEKKVPVHIGLVHRYTASIKAVRRFIKENNPGRIFSIAFNWFSTVETEIINCTNNAPNNFRLRISQIPYHCCHALDVIRLIGGEIKSVYAYSIKWMKWKYVTPDEVIALFEFENDAIGHFHYSGVAYKGGSSGLIHAENYTIGFSPWCEYEVWYRPKHKLERNDGPRDCRPNWKKHIGPDIHQFGRNFYNPEVMLDFLNAVRDGTPMKVTIEDGYKTAEIAEAIELSYERREKVNLPLKFE